MRIVGGEFRNRRLKVPRNDGTRPALEMLRGALFDMLEADLPGARVLDLFAGSGSLGLEALSRGAAHVTFVERARKVARAIEGNIATLGVQARTEVVHGDATRFRGGLFDVILLDPPFAIASDRAIAELVARAADEWLADDGLLVFRGPTTDPVPPLLDGLRRLRERTYGDSLVVIDWKVGEQGERSDGERDEDEGSPTATGPR